MNADMNIGLASGTPYYIIMPDGYGSKGDEAMITGCLNILQGHKVTFITPNQNKWSDVLIGRTHLFDELSVQLEQMPGLFREPCCLIVIGADTLDGTFGYEEAYGRLHAANEAASHGGKVVIFCSIRSDMDPRIISEWKALPDSVAIFLRDSVSEENFAKQVGKPTSHFSDLAFFSSPIQTERAGQFKEMVRSLSSAGKVIGLEISETMFRSFHTEIIDENRRAFVRQTAALAVQGLSPTNTVFVLMTHDTRGWEGHWSDYQYACVAKEWLDSEGYTCLLQPQEFTQTELLTILPEIDMIICGRMHMSISACRAGIVPVIVAGKGKNYVMVDKVRGMCREWFGSSENLTQELDQIPLLRDRVLNDSALKEALDAKNESLQLTLTEESEKLRKMLGIQPVYWDEALKQETALLKAMQRSQDLHSALQTEKQQTHNQRAHIELLLQSERDLQAKEAKFNDQIRQLQFELGFRTGITKHMQITEMELRKELEEAYRKINKLRYELGCKG